MPHTHSLYVNIYIYEVCVYISFSDVVVVILSEEGPTEKTLGPDHKSVSKLVIANTYSEVVSEMY